jgi:hypothetical protein
LCPVRVIINFSEFDEKFYMSRRTTMKHFTRLIITVCILGFLTTARSNAQQIDIKEADALCALGGVDNLKRALQFYEWLHEFDCNNFKLNLKCAIACKAYARETKYLESRGWKKLNATYGKKGMLYAQRAIELDQKNPAAHYYYGLNAASYSDGVGIIKAVREGLKSKTQKSLEKAYKLDKTYQDYGPAFALGRYWAVVSWPFRDKKKADKFYSEYLSNANFSHDKEERMVYISEFLIDRGDKKSLNKARSMLTEALKTAEPEIKKWANELLDKIK